MARSADLSRRDLFKGAGAATAAAAATPLRGAPAIHTARAASAQVPYGIVGTGSRGQYLLNHLVKMDAGRCLAVCDIYEPNLKKGVEAAGSKPATYKDYRELLARQDLDAVVVTTPLFVHFPVVRDALLAGKHVFCEKSLVFKPEEVHALRALAHERPRQIIQVGLQRRYSQFYQTAQQMIAKGMLGRITHIAAQWNRNPGWKMNPDPKLRRQLSWRLFREFSGGLTAELGSHQIDVADWIYGSSPEFVVGVGGLEYMKDGRDVYDNIQLIFRYPQGQKLTYQSVSTNEHLSLFGGARTQFGELIMGTDGSIEITVGTDNEPAIGLWYYEPGPKTAEPAQAKEKAALATATLTTTAGGQKGYPILLARDQLTGKESFLDREMKFARRWLYAKGIMVPQEQANPVDTQMLAFFDSVRTGKKPLADLEVGLADSTMVMLANLAMDEGRRVYFSEIEKMGRAPDPARAKRA
jgi:predicted dehydrogenase